MSLRALRERLRQQADSAKAKVLKRFFKMRPGEYGEGDIFLGVTVPKTRNIAKEFQHLSLKDAASLLRSKLHEERLAALLILILKYNKAQAPGKEKIYRLYLKHTRYINNWDLVDLSAPSIAGAFLWDKSRKPLYALAKSKRLWERRISLLANFYFIRNGDFDDALRIACLLLNDKEDLIHKALGWMLREIGKRDQTREEEFLDTHHSIMPRTALRYAIERFPESKKRYYMSQPRTSG